MNIVTIPEKKSGQKNLFYLSRVVEGRFRLIAEEIAEGRLILNKVCLALLEVRCGVEKLLELGGTFLVVGDIIYLVHVFGVFESQRE